MTGKVTRVVFLRANMTMSLIKFFKRFLPDYKIHIVVRGKTIDGDNVKLTVPYNVEFDKTNIDELRELFAELYWQTWDAHHKELKISTLVVEDVVRLK
jgi:hypothetical protein